MYVGTCSECIYGLKCPCKNSLNSAACLTIAKKGKPKQTNADRIRSMSDDELEKFIVGLNEHCLAGIGECDCSGEATKPCSRVCMRKTREWLQSEVEE